MALAGLGVLVLGKWFAGKPSDLGAVEGRLARCPDSPNCVCSQDDRESHLIQPLEYQGDGEAAWERLVGLLKNRPRTEIIERTETYLHVEFTTPVLRFVDDGEFLLDEEDHVIQVRSASRVGHSAMAKNRERMEKIRAAFQAASEDS